MAEEKMESDGLAGRMPANTGALNLGVTLLRPSDLAALIEKIMKERPDLSRERAEGLAKKRISNKANAHKWPSMQLRACLMCSRPCSPKSTYCARCFQANRDRITRDVKARRKLFRHEKDRTVYRMRAPILERLETAKTAQDLLSGRPAPAMGKDTEWLSPEKRALCLLVGADADIARASIILGRSASALAWKAKHIGLKLPESWREKIAYGPSPKRLDLAFPYISKARPEHSDLLRVNDIVPKSFPEWQRADICQSIMLALFEGQVTLGELESHKDKPRWFIKEYYKKQQPWQEMFGIGKDDDERSYEDIAASRIGHNSMAMPRFVEPTQIEETFQGQITAYQKRAAARGRLLTLEEASWEMDAASVPER